MLKSSDKIQQSKFLRIHVHGSVGVGKTTYLKKYQAYQNAFYQSGRDLKVLYQVNPPTDPLFFHPVIPLEEARVLLEPVDLWKEFLVSPSELPVDLLSNQYESTSGIFELQTYIRKTFMDLHCLPCSVPCRIMERSIHAASAFVTPTGMTPVQYAIEKSWQETCRNVPLFDEDLIIYLHCPVEVALERIRERARAHETSCTIEKLLQLEERYRTNVLEPHRRVLFVDTNRPIHWGFKDFCEKISDHYFKYKTDKDYMTKIRRGDLQMPRSVSRRGELGLSSPAGSSSIAAPVPVVETPGPSSFQDVAASHSALGHAVHPSEAWIAASSGTPSSSSSSSSFSSVLMMTLPEEEQCDIVTTNKSDKPKEKQENVVSLSLLKQEKPPMEQRREALAEHMSYFRNPSPPPEKVRKGLDNLSSLLTNLEESWTTVKPQLTKQDSEQMEEEDIIVPEPPSLAHLRQPQASDQKMKSPLAPVLVKTEEASSLAAPVATSVWTSHRIGRCPRKSSQPPSPQEEPPTKSRLMTALRQLPSRLARLLPSSPVIIGEKTVRDLSVQESTVYSFTLNGKEYSLPKTIPPATAEKSTSLSIHDLLKEKYSAEYRKFKEHTYRSFLNEPLRPYTSGSLLHWDRLMQIDLTTAQELKHQLSGDRIEKFPYYIDPSCHTRALT